MNDKQEFYAATVGEAVDKASAALGIAQDRLEFEVLDRGSTGFLGIGARDARILVEAPQPEAGVPAASVLAAGNDDQPPESSYEERVLPVEEPLEAARLSESNTPATDASYELVVAVDEFMTALIEAIG